MPDKYYELKKNKKTGGFILCHPDIESIELDPAVKWALAEKKGIDYIYDADQPVTTMAPASELFNDAMTSANAKANSRVAALPGMCAGQCFKHSSSLVLETRRWVLYINI